MSMRLFPPRPDRKLQVTIDGRTYLARADRDVLLDLAPDAEFTLDDISRRLQLVTPGFRPDSNIVPIKGVDSPNHLVVSRVWFTPTTLHKQKRFDAKVEVTDRRGRLVSGALVSIRSVPEQRAAPIAQKVTGADGTVSFSLTPSKHARRGGRLTMFIRASKVGEAATDETSGRRLVTLALSGAAA